MGGPGLPPVTARWPEHRRYVASGMPMDATRTEDGLVLRFHLSGIDPASLSDYEPGAFPALLQTPAYARAVHESALPPLSSDVIEQRIESRRLRQEVLWREEPPHLKAVIDEAVLHRAVGGPMVMHEQLQRMIAANEMAQIHVRVLPYSAGSHPALDSTFVILEFAAPVPGVVYVDGLVGQIYLERPQDFDRYKQVFERLWELSLSPAETRKLMEQTDNEYKKKIR